MSALSNIVSRFTRGRRTRPTTGGPMTPPTAGTGRSTRSTDEAIGRGVRGALGRLRGRR